MQVVVNDHGEPQKEAIADVSIKVVDSQKQAPVFTEFPQEPIYLKENFSDYEHTIALFKAR